MAGINSRVFGSDIPNKVKAKLEIRQALSKNPNIRYDNNAELKRIQEKYNGVQDIDPYQVTDDIIKAEIGDFLQTASGIERSDANFYQLELHLYGCGHVLNYMMPILMKMTQLE